MAIFAANVTVLDGEDVVTVMKPEKRFYKKPRQPTTEVAIHSTLREDVYVILGAYDPDTKAATFQAYVNPLVAWLWIGGLVLVMGTGVAVYPSAAERAAVHATRAAPAGAATT